MFKGSRQECEIIFARALSFLAQLLIIVFMRNSSKLGIELDVEVCPEQIVQCGTVIFA